MCALQHLQTFQEVTGTDELPLKLSHVITETVA